MPNTLIDILREDVTARLQKIADWQKELEPIKFRLESMELLLKLNDGYSSVDKQLPTFGFLHHSGWINHEGPLTESGMEVVRKLTRET